MNYKTVKKEIEKTLENRKTSHIHGLSEYSENGREGAGESGEK
jgi:hypothetical protein